MEIFLILFFSFAIFTPLLVLCNLFLMAKEEQKQKFNVTSAIEILNLTSSKLENFPEDIGDISELRYLLISENRFKELPKIIGSLSQLKILEISENQLQELPESISNLYQLEKLDVSGNQLKKLPESIGKLYQLKELNVSGNQLKELPESIGKLSQLKYLNISGNQLKELPVGIGKLSQLEDLIASRNQLQKLPYIIGNLSQLIGLELDENQLEEIPKSIGYLPELGRLMISSNQLQKLPDSFENLTELRRLDIENNQLKEALKSIGNLSKLEEIAISGNQLSKNIDNLSQVRVLCLSGSQCKELPKSIGRLSQLRRLYLGNNEFKELPKSIGHLSNLKSLDLGNNKLLKEQYGLSGYYIEADELRNLRSRLREQRKNQPKVVWSGSTYAISKDEYFKELSSVDGYKLYQEALIQEDAQLFYKAGEKYDRSYNAINGDIVFSGCSKQDFAFNFGINIDYFDDNDFISLLDKMQKFLVFSCHCYFKALEINPNHYMANLKLATALTTALKVPYAKFFWMKALNLDQKGTIRAIVSDANGPGLKGFASKVIFQNFKEKLDPEQVATAAMFAGNNHLNPNSNINKRIFMEQLSKAKNIFQADDYVTNKLEKMKEKYRIKDIGESKN